MDTRVEIKGSPLSVEPAIGAGIQTLGVSEKSRNLWVDSGLFTETCDFVKLTCAK